MAISTVFLSSFFLSLVFLIAPSHCILDPTSTTLAISQATGTVCGITAGSQNHSIQCTIIHELDGLNASFPIYPTLSFDTITGGRNFICSLRSGDVSFYCWDGINQRVKRVYSGPSVLTELSVGARHVSTIEGDPMRMQTIRWWRYGCHNRSRPCPDFPKSIDGFFHSLTSGDTFTCAIDETHKVNCWGPDAKSIMTRFAGVYMRSLTAGGSRMCGLNMTGHLICSDDQLNETSGEAFVFTTIAIGSSHTCAIWRTNGTVVCWDHYSSYAPVGSITFEFLVAGGDLVCGLTKNDLNVACWNLNWRNLSAINLLLPKILPGVCVPHEIVCSCGVYPDSETLCGGSGFICKRFDANTTDSCQFLSLIEQPQAPSLTTWEWLSKWSFIYAIAGAAFVIAVIGHLLYLKCSKITPPIEYMGQFSLNDLKKATYNFPKCCRLRVGVYGAVYRGWLPDGRRVAVKYCFDLGSREFDSEVYMLSMCHHVNVVNLIGFCRETNERLMVFEFMRNKDLYENLHPKPWGLKSQLYSSWKLRVKVLLDAANGIDFLHRNGNSRIIHRNINSRNILLDEHWVAKIADFGFALFGPAPGMRYVNVETLTGQAGYIAPEYLNNLCVYPSSDVYSFGVVMFEVLTGREAFKNGVHLANEVAPIVSAGNFLRVLDRRLPLPEGQQRDAMQLVAQLASFCVNESYIYRPFMRTVVLQLQTAYRRFDPDARFN
ncbi:hypothetical protein LUZ61_003583 [Rhynchospora tenuis]|uniref:Protein kinase domain-containing protein n=1 Tax=Rhynchospora tenuis TaxID=198213 RepID=A0AAD5ZL82_9POAL|nr:hypothetical protein LUZ61_003583 [Rhynchospora tenuis]